MQVAARSNSTRSYLAAGVALVGAGAIAVSSVAPPLPDVQIPAISSAAVNLSAAVDPFQAYVQLITNTIDNVGTLVDTEIADPLPILQQVLANQISNGQAILTGLQDAGEALGRQLDPSNPYGIPAQLQKAMTQLAAGDVNGAFATTWSTFLGSAFAALPVLTPITNAIAQPVQNLANVLKDPLVVLYPVLGALSVAYTTFTTNGNVGQNIVDAVNAGDVLGVVNAVLAGPAQIADTFLNGSELGGGGIFGPSFGLLSALRTARDAIAKDIAPPAPVTAAVAEVTAPPKAAANVVTLDVAPAPKQQTTTATTKSTPSVAAAEGSAATGSAAVESDSSVAGTVSAPATDGAKTGSATKPTRTNGLKQVQDGVKSAVKNITDGLKKVTAGASGKSSTGTKSESQSGSTGSGSGASSQDAA